MGMYGNHLFMAGLNIQIKFYTTSYYKEVYICSIDKFYIATGLNYRVFRSFLNGPRVINHGITKKLSEVKYRLLGAF